MSGKQTLKKLLDNNTMLEIRRLKYYHVKQKASQIQVEEE